MPIRCITPDRTIQADLVAYDRDSAPVLLVEVKGVTPAPGSISQLIRNMRATVPPTPFGMIVGPETIAVHRLDRPDPEMPVLALDTEGVFRSYSEQFDKHRIYNTYLMEAITGHWLDDLSRRWRATPPPAIEAIRGVGLLDRLEGGSTESEVSIG